MAGRTGLGHYLFTDRQHTHDVPRASTTGFVHPIEGGHGERYRKTRPGRSLEHSGELSRLSCSAAHLASWQDRAAGDSAAVSCRCTPFSLRPVRPRDCAPIAVGRDRKHGVVGAKAASSAASAVLTTPAEADPKSPAGQVPQRSASLLTVAQLRAVPASRADVGPPALANTRRSSLGGYPSGVCR